MSLCKTPTFHSVAGVLEPASHHPQPGPQILTTWLLGLGRSSRPTMLVALRRAVRAADPASDARLLDVPWGRMSLASTLSVRVGLEGMGRPASRNLSLTAWKSVAAAAWQLGHLQLDELQRIRGVKGFRHHGETGRGRFLSPAERTRLFSGGEGESRVDLRDRALFALLLGGGLRRAEAAGLTRQAVDLSDGVITVDGKGGRVRRVPLSAPVKVALATWMEALPPQCMHLFPPLSRTGRALHNKPMTGAAVADLLARRSETTGIGQVRPHDLRRTCASDLLSNGVDLLTTQQLLGHASAATTLRYDLRPENARRVAVEAVFVPV
jgi:integrase